jgi:hypothetical protein
MSSPIAKLTSLLTTKAASELEPQVLAGFHGLLDVPQRVFVASIKGT